MKNCAFCQTPFESKRDRLCCTRSCSAKIAMQRKGIRAWTQSEIDFLTTKAGSYPFRKLVEVFNRWADKHGFPTRTNVSIAVMVRRLSLSRKCTEDNFTVNGLAEGLGISRDCLRGFVLRGKLHPKKISRNQSSVTRKQAIELVLNNPGKFALCDRDKLFWLLESDRLVEQVKSHTPSIRGYRRAVRCYSPQGIKSYPGIKEAARANYVAHGCISQAIARNGKSAGMRWEYC